MMDVKAAIKTLRSNYPDVRYTMLREAVDMAIDALEKQQAQDVRPVTSQKVIDLITQVVDDQDTKGLIKYGHSLDKEMRETNHDWQHMALEETVDGMKYLLMENLRLRRELLDRASNTLE